MRAQQKPIKDIAAEIGLSPSSIYGWMVRYGIPRRPWAQRLADCNNNGTARLHEYWLPQARLIALWREHATVDAVAELAHLSTTVVRERLIAARALPAPRPSERYQRIGDSEDPLSRERLRHLYVERQLGATEIARLTGTTRDKVYYRIRAYNLPRRRPGPRSVLDDLTPERLRHLCHEEQLSITTIAAMLNCSRPSVLRRLRQYDIQSAGTARRPREPYEE